MVMRQRPWQRLNHVALAMAVAVKGERPALPSDEDSRCPPRLKRLIARWGRAACEVYRARPK
jgi:hypothetical protein